LIGAHNWSRKNIIECEIDGPVQNERLIRRRIRMSDDLGTRLGRAGKDHEPDQGMLRGRWVRAKNNHKSKKATNPKSGKRNQVTLSFATLSNFPESMPIWDNLVKADSEIQGDQTEISEEFSRILDLSKRLMEYDDLLKQKVGARECPAKWDQENG
jgi:hypothetical protein